jgi:O-acetyl-ADP-ribose deacetylase (regulator of RNase III)
VLNDIAEERTEVIVNAANETLLPGGGVCGAIF